jgi:hypothetical protein
MSIQERLQTDLKEAMRSDEKLRLEVIRGARAALQSAQQEIAKQHYDAAVRAVEERFAGDAAAREAALASIQADPHLALDDAAQEAVIAKEVKRRRDAAEVYRKGGRNDLAETEEAEARVLEGYLPQQLSAEELQPQIAAIIAEQGLSGPAAMGKLMPILIERFRGRADGRLLSQLARESLLS